MHEKTTKLFNILFAIFIFIVAFLVRFHNVGLLPINHDEANWARFLLMNPEFIKKFLGIPIIPPHFIPFSLQDFLLTHISGPKIFSLNEFTVHMRFQPVIIGAITVLLIYALAGQMYGRKAAVACSLLLCFLPWHIIHSRIIGRVIWIPFFGCLIFLSLFKAIQEKRKLWAWLWFLLSCFFLRVSLRVYESAVLFIPIFFVSFIWLGKEIKYSRKQRAILITILITLLFISTAIFLSLGMNGKLREYFYRGYHKDIFEGSLFFNLWENTRNNVGFAIKDLFFNFSGSSFLYGKALKAPLLIHPIVFFLFMVSLVFSIYQRKASDKILLVWLFLGFLGGVSGVNFFQPRYILIILPPFVIFIGKFIADIFNRLPKKNFLKRKFLLIIWLVLYLWLIITEVTQWMSYYYAAPFNLEECRTNSYGCKEAAEYLSQIPDIKNYHIITDFRMTLDVYLNYYLLNKGKIDRYCNFRPDKSEREQKEKIYIFWAPESHSKDYCNGLFWYPYDFFRQRYPNKVSIKTIYYPNGLAAIHIFKVEDDTEI